MTTPWPLEPNGSELRAMGASALELVARFCDGLPTAPSAEFGGIDLAADLLAPPPEAPGDFATLLETFRQAAGVAVETAGPGYFGYIPGGGIVVSALAEMLARSVNRYAGMSAFAPALVAMEESILRWLGDEFRLPASAGGLITTGGSMATLAAVVAARHDRLGESFADGTIYVTDQTHLCVAKAARVAGFPAARVRFVPTTPDLQMDVAAAEAMIAADRAARLRPFLLVGTAGTTNTGAVDPLAALADLARHAKLWFHVDGAYGGCFQLTNRGRAKFAGIEAADSIVLDPHKGLFLPYGTGVLLVRDRAKLRAAHVVGADYLQDAADDHGLPDYGSLGAELTREFRGLRLWLPFHLHGVAAFRAALDEKLDLAAGAYEHLACDQRLEVPWEPELSVVAFRRLGTDEENAAFLTRINAAKRVFLSSTRVRGRHTLRLCILSHRTHAEHVAEALCVVGSALGEPLDD